MIELPAGYTVATASPTLIDYGVTQEANGRTEYIARPGSRYAISVNLGPFYPEDGRVILARMLSAKRKGFRMAYPLQHDQGTPGTTLVNGAVTAASETLNIKGATPGYQCKEGFWLSIQDGSGNHYLHNVETGATATAGGLMTITVSPPLRFDFANNSVVNLSVPKVQGLIAGNQIEWSMSVDRMLPIAFELIEQ